MMLGEQSRPSPDFRRPTKVFDFFSGCGGASAGLRAAGMEVAFGLDNDRDAEQIFQAMDEAHVMTATWNRLVPGNMIARTYERAGDPLAPRVGLSA